MKRHQLISTLTFTFVFVLAGGLTCQTESQAQDGPFQKLIPRGRLIQKLRDDLNNGKPFISDPFARSEPAAPSPATRKPKAPAKKLPTAASKKAPTAAASKNGGKNKVESLVGNGRNDLRRPPQTLEGQFKSPTNARRPNGNASLLAPAPFKNTELDSPDSAMTIVGDNIDPVKIKATQGFGMVLKSVAETTLVVARLNPQGNAAQAGVKLGDKIESVGGVEIDSLLLFDEITKEMGAGDQLEFVVVRKGKKDKMLVQFGEMPKFDEGQVSTQTESAPAYSPTQKNPTIKLQSPVTNRREPSSSFAPPTTTQGLRSVLEGSGGQSIAPNAGGLNNQIDFPALNGPSLNGPRK